MKKIIFVSALTMVFFTVGAQVEIKATSFELESQNKHKGWKIIEAGRDAGTNKVYVKFAQPICDMTKSAWTGVRTYKGLKWNIDKLYFDNNFAYQNTDSKNYESSEEAMLNGEVVFGKTFMPTPTKIGKAIFQGGAGLTRNLNNAFMFKSVVSGTAAISGFKITVSEVTCEPLAEDTKTQGTLCGEIPVTRTILSNDAKEEKGQRWIVMYSNPIPNGGNILFNTVGVSADPNVQYYVFRKYNENGTMIKEKALSFQYQCVPTVKEIETAPGVFDYVLVMSPINYKKSTLRVVPANQYEYIRIDGETFDVKEQFQITTPNSQWRINQLFEKSGTVYLLGDAGKTANTYSDFSIPKESDYPNFQIAKIQNGKLAYASLIAENNIKEAIKIINNEKLKPAMSLRVVDLQMQEVNGKFIYSGQQFAEGKRGGAIINAIFNENGTLETVLTKGVEFSMSNLSFSADNKVMYWLIHDVTQHNKWDEKTGIITPKEAKQVLTALSVVSYNFENKEVKYQDATNEEWGVMYKDPILFNSDNEVVLLGGKLSKKAKESEVAFISIKK